LADTAAPQFLQKISLLSFGLTLFSIELSFWGTIGGTGS